MRIPAAAALSLVVVLGACGGGGDDTAEPTPTPTRTTASPSPAASKVTGKPAPADLASFRCAKNADGRWNAIAVVKNGTKKAQDYQITVHVGPAEGEASPARTQSVGRVNAGGSVTVKVLKIPASAPDGPCQVQLLANPV
ncbi:hypothetical protein [Aeromicrobium terrae]|uniref:Uncharacterized protein n=1 Tax=Aeromicrobium terrae TaxID=2498846 RepID=A0A5C8NFB3_9ACTN|nr:hypothetical protein [Aeromicrobium terrae]TXL57603.1 hypothetical protein FHP06_12490 [Aeromicrobium terrae]